MKFVKESTPTVVVRVLGTFARYVGDTPIADAPEIVRDDRVRAVESTLQEAQLSFMGKLQMPTADPLGPEQRLQESRDEPWAMRPQFSSPNLLAQRQQAYLDSEARRQKAYIDSQSLSNVQRRLVNAFVSVFNALVLVVGPVLSMSLLLASLGASTTTLATPSTLLGDTLRE